jgi:integrase
MNGRKTLAEVQRQVDKHLLEYFPADRRMSTITTTDLERYVVHRKEEGASAATCNNELATIRRAFRLARRAGELTSMPYIPMLTLDNVRTGFFERDQFEGVRDALPQELRGLVTFAYLTGWRVRSEVLPLQWSQVDRNAKTVRLEPGTTKNRRGRTLPYDLLPELVAVIDEQWTAHEALKAQDVICPFVFQRGGQPDTRLPKDVGECLHGSGLPGQDSPRLPTHSGSEPRASGRA